MTHKMIYRKATAADYEGVLGILPPSEVMGGADYVPDYYHSIIEQPNNLAYVALADSKIVSFGFLTIVDGGITIVARGGRVHKAFQGLGISRKLSSYVTKGLLNTNHRYFVGVGRAGIESVERNIAQGIEYSVLQMRRVYFKIPTKRLKSVIGASEKQEQDSCSAKKLDVHSLKEILTNQTLCEDMFPAGRFIVDKVPYRIMEQNAELILNQRTVGFISRTHYEDDENRLSSDSKVSKSSDKSRATNILETTSGKSRAVVATGNNPLITFGTCYNSSVGFVCNFEAYGNLNDVSSHLEAHFRNVLARCKSDNVLFQCFLLGDEDCKTIGALMERYGFANTAFWNSGLICHEMEIDFMFLNKFQINKL